MGPTATWDYIGKISPAIPTLRRLVDHVEGTVNVYRRYKKHTIKSAEDDITGLMVMFQESGLYDRVPGRKVEAREKFVDTLARGFNIVSKGESLTRWFKNRSELQPVRDDGVSEYYDDPTPSELEEMDSGDDYSYINLHHRVWLPAGDDAPNESMSF